MKNNPSIESLTREIHDLKGLVVDLITYIQEQDDKALGGWISEERTKKLTGLSTSSLYRLRKSGKVRASFIVGKGIFYQSSDFKRLLDTNHRLR